MPFKENQPIERRKDTVTGRDLIGKYGCKPFNKKKLNQIEMDEYFLGDE